MKGLFHLEIIGNFAGHIFAGVCMFVGMLLGGIATKHAVLMFEPLMGGHALHDALHVLETLFLWTDVSFLAWWCVFSTFKACQSIVKSM